MSLSWVLSVGTHCLTILLACEHLPNGFVEARRTRAASHAAVLVRGLYCVLPELILVYQHVYRARTQDNLMHASIIS